MRWSRISVGKVIARRSPSGSTIPIWVTRARQDVGQRGELNVGQLAREKYGRDAVLIGFTTYHGTVTAASDWGQPAERKHVRPALAGSYEALFHAAQRGRFLLIWRESDSGGSTPARSSARAGNRRDLPSGNRAAESLFPGAAADQFDAVLHFDETRAVEPLEPTAEWEVGEVPETFPFAV